MSTDIDWADESINPQGWGCWGPGGTPEEPRRCWYCYLKRLQKWPGSKCGLCQQLIPHWHPERLEWPYRWRKPRTSDLFHLYTPAWQIKKVIGVAKATPQHTHIFCTKNPLRYSAYNPWPSNCWLLTTITNQQDADERIPELLRAQAPVRGVSLEPLLGPVDFIKHWGLPFERQGSSILRGHPLLRRLQWLIIGAMTGPGYMQHLPKREWIQNLINQARDAGVPLFIKDNVNWREKTQEAEKWMSVPPARSCII